MNELYNIIKQKIKENNGAICFREFMRICLYEPRIGYYEKFCVTTGRKGDFYTSVSVGPLFGWLLACKFCLWFERLYETGFRVKDLHLIEAGANDGNLAYDILSWIKTYKPEIFNSVRYVIVEPSETRRQLQMGSLKGFQNTVVWIPDLLLKDEIQRGLCNEDAYQIIFSNELLDAMPFHRLIWLHGDKKWMEIGVGLENEKLRWRFMQPCADANNFIKFFESELMPLLENSNRNFVFELPSEAIEWYRTASRFLRRGIVAMFDYGFARMGLINPEKPNGTMRSYFKHHVSDCVFDNIGEQDITIDVNFDFFIREGEKSGLRTVFFGSQQAFLTNILRDNNKIMEADWFMRNIAQFKTLTHPEHLGCVMKVLVQKRDLTSVVFS